MLSLNVVGLPHLQNRGKREQVHHLRTAYMASPAGRMKAQHALHIHHPGLLVGRAERSTAAALFSEGWLGHTPWICTERDARRDVYHPLFPVKGAGDCTSLDGRTAPLAHCRPVTTCRASATIGIKAFVIALYLVGEVLRSDVIRSSSISHTPGRKASAIAVAGGRWRG